MTITDIIHRLNRAQIENLLEEYAGIQCYDYETMEELREAVQANVEDETIEMAAIEAILED